MQISLIVCIIGEDRTGLVESLSRLITDQGGNWLESRMCSLASKFAGIVRIHVPKEREESLVRSLEDSCWPGPAGDNSSGFGSIGSSGRECGGVGIRMLQRSNVGRKDIQGHRKAANTRFVHFIRPAWRIGRDRQ